MGALTRKHLVGLALLVITAQSAGALCGLLPAAAQSPFPQTVPPNTVVGRPGAGPPGPASDIPIASIFSSLGNVSFGGTGGSWFTDVGARYAFVSRIRDRLFIDAGALNSGAFNGGNSPLANTGVGAEINNIGWNWAATNASLYALNSQSTMAIVGQATAIPTPAGGGKVPIGVSCFGLNDQTASNTLAVWGCYSEAAVTGGMGQAVAHEFDIGNTGPTAVYSLWAGSGNGGGYNSLGAHIACGGSAKSSVSYGNCSSGIDIVTNRGVTSSNPKFDKGIVITPNSLVTQGGGFQNAVNLADTMRINWFANNSGADLLEGYLQANNYSVLLSAPQSVGAVQLSANGGNQTLTVNVNGVAFSGAPVTMSYNANGTYPSSAVNSSWIWNFSGGSREVDFFNDATSATDSFRFYQLTGASAATLLLDIQKTYAQWGSTAPVHLASGQTTKPTVTSCGTGSVAAGSTDTAGQAAATGATGCTVVFNVPYKSQPFCSVTDNTTANGLKVAYGGTSNAAQFTVTGLTSGDSFTWICMGQAGG
jgi:hypothetical protein